MFKGAESGPPGYLISDFSGPEAKMLNIHLLSKLYSILFNAV